MLIKTLELIKTHWRGFLLGIFVAFLCLKVHSCDRKHYENHPPVASKPILPKDDKEQIIVKNGKVEVITSKGVQTVTGSRETIVNIKKDGTIKVSEQTHGFEHQVGFNGYISKDMNIGLDLRYFYYKQFDAMMGIGYAPQTKHLDGWLGLGYTTVTSWTSNTTVFMGYSPINHAAVAGISLRF
jgi:hypothetical protein